MRRVVVIPLNPAVFTPAVIPMVAELGRRTDIALHLLDVRGEKEGGSRVLEGVTRQLSDQLGSTRVRSAVRSGQVNAVLGQYAREHEAELIAIGLEEGDPTSEQAAIPIARRLASRTGAAVFVLASSREGKRGTFVADLDGSELARARLELALTSARIAGVRDLTVQALPAGGAASGEAVIAR